MRQVKWWVVGAAVGVLGLAGCAHEAELKPAASANTLPADKYAAKASAQGVTVVADGRAWEGVPDDLDEVVPVRVAIRNFSDKPLRLRYRELALVGPQGSRFVALPPFQIDGTAYVDAPVTGVDAYGGAGPVPLAGPWEPGFYYNGFYTAPTYSPMWTGITPWAGPFAADPLYYDTYYTQWPVELPTANMVASALPEGVIEPNGSVSGFVYFQDVPEGVDRVDLRLDLVDANTGEQFGQVSIPFIPKDA